MHLTTCEHCGAEIPRPVGMSWFGYHAKRHCNRLCASRAAAGSHKMEARYWPTEAAWAMDTSERSAS